MDINIKEIVEKYGDPDKWIIDRGENHTRCIKSPDGKIIAEAINMGEAFVIFFLALDHYNGEQLEVGGKP